MNDDYWFGVAEIAIQEAGLSASAKQLDTIAGVIEGCFENYNTGRGYDSIPNQLEQEVKLLKRELDKERNKTYCEECNGKGSISYCDSAGSGRGGFSRCWKCNGEGRL